MKMKAIHGMGMDRNVTPWFCGRSPHGHNRVYIAAVGGRCDGTAMKKTNWQEQCGQMEQSEKQAETPPAFFVGIPRDATGSGRGPHVHRAKT